MKALTWHGKGDVGYPRFTGDIDILLALDEKNLQKMGKVMGKLGYERRIPMSIEELGDEKHVIKLMEEKNILAYTFVNAKEPLFQSRRHCRTILGIQALREKHT